MSKTILFAIDKITEEIIVSESPKGSTTVHFIERIRHQDNEILFNAVATLTSISKSPDFDMGIFKSMDKVCQMIYTEHSAN